MEEKETYIDINSLKSIDKKLIEGYIEAHLNYMHFKNVRDKYREALLEQLSKNPSLQYKGRKLIDKQKKIVLYVQWGYEWHLDEQERRESIEKGKFNSVYLQPYKCIVDKPKIKHTRGIKNPLKLLKQGDK